MLGSCSIVSAGGLCRLGPENCEGEARLEKIGSVKMILSFKRIKLVE